MATKRRRLLVVDDDKQLRDRYQRGLASEFEVKTVAGATQAIKHLKNESFDLIITDQTVADADGFELLGRLRDHEIHTPVILLAEALDNQNVLRAREYDALCLAKPIDVQTLTKAVHSRMRSFVSERSGLPAAARGLKSVTATYAKKEFRRVLETAAQAGRVLITKYQDPRAVLLSFEEYERLTATTEPALEQLSAEFDELVVKMQAPAARAGTAALFSVSSDDLGKAAVDAAKKCD